MSYRQRTVRRQIGIVAIILLVLALVPLTLEVAGVVKNGDGYVTEEEEGWLLATTGFFFGCGGPGVALGAVWLYLLLSQRDKTG